MIRFEGALRRLREVEPKNPQLTYVARPNTVPSEALVARLEAELAAALGRVSLSQPPRPLGNQLAQPAAIERQEALISEVANSGLKITPSAVVRIERMPNGQIVFLEQGNNASGLRHIIKEHGGEFVQAGISNDKLPDFLMSVRRDVRITGYQGQGTSWPIYELTYEGRALRIALTVGSNGYVVGAK